MRSWIIGALTVVLWMTVLLASGCAAEEPALMYCTYSSAGSKPGGHLYMKLSQQKDGKVQATLSAQDTWRAPTVERTVEVPREKLDELAARFPRDKMLRWAAAPKSADDVRDADTVTVIFRYADKSEAELNDYQDLPQEAIDALRELHTYLRAFFPDVQLRKRHSKHFSL